jgi:hypothetical protein
MSAMREAFEKWFNEQDTRFQNRVYIDDALEIWQAAIEHIKAQGAVARLIPVQTDVPDTPRVWARTWGEYSAESSFANPYRTGDEISLYRLPEDI